MVLKEWLLKELLLKELPFPPTGDPDISLSLFLLGRFVDSVQRIGNGALSAVGSIVRTH